MGEQFFLTLNSDTACHFRQHNRLSNFRVHLGQTIQLQGQWEVALFEIYVPSTLKNLPDEACQILHDKTSFDAETGEIGYRGDRGFQTVLLESRYYSREKDLIDEINKKMMPKLQCTIDNYKRISIFINEFDDNGEISSFHLSPKLRDILGLPRVGSIGGSTENGLFNPVLGGGAVIESDMHVDLNRGLPATLSLCTNIICEQMVNNSHTRVLRSFETGARNYKFGFVKRVEFAKLVFLPLSQDKFEYIDLLIKDDSGREASFLHGTVTAVLLFRKVSHE
jgi:hypothetical protein